MTARSRESEGFNKNHHLPTYFGHESPDFRCFPADDYTTDNASQVSDDDRWSIDGFDSDYDALDSQTEDIYVPPRLNYGYPREPYRPSTASQRTTFLRGQFRGTNAQFTEPPSYRGAYPRGDLPRQTTAFSRQFRGVGYPSWVSQDDTDVSDSSVTTEDTSRGRFTYGFNNRNRDTKAKSNMTRDFLRSTGTGEARRQGLEDPASDEDEEEEDSESSSEFMSTSSASTPRQAPQTNSKYFVDIKTIQAAFHAYESRWAVLSKGYSQRLTFKAIPWPQHPAPSSVADINMGNILTFLKLGGAVTVKTAVRQALLRFHPDKTAGLLINVEERDRESVMTACAAVARCLNEIHRTL